MGHSLTERAFERRMGGAGLRRKLRGGARLRSWYGITVASTSDYYATANPGGIAGVGTGFSLWGAICVTSQGVASSNKRIAARSNATNAGWQVVIGGTNTLLSVWMYDGGGVNRVSPIYTITAADLNTVLFWHAYYNGTALFLYVNGAQVTGSTAFTGFTAHSGATTLASNLGAPVSTRIVGLAGGASVITAGEITANIAAGRAARDVTAISGKTDHLWSVARDQQGTAPTTLTNQAGSGNMTKAGSPTLVRFT